MDPTPSPPVLARPLTSCCVDGAEPTARKDGLATAQSLDSVPRPTRAGDDDFRAVDVSLGANHTLVLSADRLVHSCGCGESGQLGRGGRDLAHLSAKDREDLSCNLLPVEDLGNGQVLPRAANSRGPGNPHRTPWHPVEGPLDPLQKGKVP